MISTAILLAAGQGSRLRSAAAFKPLCDVAGRSLIAHALEGFAEAGLTRAVVVLGYGAAEIVAHLASRAWPLAVDTVINSDFERPNGTSVLAAEPLVGKEEALLAMCDHLVEPALYRVVAEAGAAGGARLGIDRRIDSEWIDVDDVTRVLTNDDRIVAIGKGLIPYDCFDTGVFAISPSLFRVLHDLEFPALTDGMRALAAERSAITVDCSAYRWIDIDDHVALGKATRWATAR